MECPLLVWMLFLNREMTSEEYERCYQTVQTCVPHSRVPSAPTNPETMRQVVAHMLPLLMMRHRRIPRAKWRDQISPNGKHYIEQDVDSAMHPANRLRAMIGYHLCYDNNVVGMVMTQGRMKDVVNVGLGVKQLCVFPPEATVAAYAESFHHKLTPLEQSFIAPGEPDDVILRRLCLLLALKQAYIKAIGQPMGFDWTRLEFNIPGEACTGDGLPLQGWEFRVWQAQIGITRNGTVIEEVYQCAVAFFRGTRDTKFIWQKDVKDLESWVQFINLDQLVNVVPKLTD
ncbi:uncharacterized protein LAESUDRAFT_732117 [Laetiporus sulphureus 93-53]|uniref:holo-[acyl-carrier-protein] synthase n=1 Tax=Laetiporus sulphureus 93-53 TaxID=1314785 RepID=A0A165BAH3_9APHY|nr:uncharacterized protein LAESUDRAFT_732117 [Laetiporus sulphureus 93-53]KZT00618.1 hypothetical protein LAESUDRAFT_732117 [Laetiporus sulphureus 93-53]